MFKIFGRNKQQKENVKLFYKTDMHCHIMPGVDHGSQSVEESIEMLKAEMAMGISRVILTSHTTAETFENTPETLAEGYEILKQAVEEEGLNIELHYSSEYRIDEYWDQLYSEGRIVPMPGKFLMLENSFVQELISIDELMFDLSSKGYKPILAHPERYSYYHQRRTRYQKLHSMGVKFQVNLLSLAGYFGGGARENAYWLLEHNLVDMLGSDMHSVEHAQIIQHYLNSKEWAKLQPRLEGRIVNDMIK
jgi:tyrosine-protein phosphatase YwqE